VTSGISLGLVVCNKLHGWQVASIQTTEFGQIVSTAWIVVYDIGNTFPINLPLLLYGVSLSKVAKSLSLTANAETWWLCFGGNSP